MKNNFIYNKKAILDYIEKENISKTEFCKRCKIGFKTLNKVLLNDADINLKPIFKIVRFINIKPSEFFIA